MEQTLTSQLLTGYCTPVMCLRARKQTIMVPAFMDRHSVELV
jgi:hypothetical protein